LVGGGLLWRRGGGRGWWWRIRDNGKELRHHALVQLHINRQKQAENDPIHGLSMKINIEVCLTS
jgi:hypothetical protein